MAKIVCANIFYAGTVQGVGFRYTTQQFAKQLDLSGWVKNLPNREVEILVEGPQKAIDELCRQIEDRFSSYIRDKKVIFVEPKDLSGQFDVVF